MNCCKPPYLFCSYTPSANQNAIVPAQLRSCSEVVRQNSLSDFLGFYLETDCLEKLQYPSEFLSVQNSRSDKVFHSFMEAISSSSEHAAHAVPFPSEWRQHNFPQLFISKKKKKFTLLLPLENHHTPPPNPDSILFFCLSLRSLSFTPLKLAHAHTRLLKFTCS